MKTKHFIYAIGLAALPLLASCSDDDDFPTEVKPAATGTFTDADGREYRTVKYGQTEWMAENYRGGDPWVEQSYLTDNGLEYWFEDDFDIDEEEELLEREGNYMNYQQALDNCPEGWRLPTDDDWKELERAVGGFKLSARHCCDGLYPILQVARLIGERIAPIAAFVVFEEAEVPRLLFGKALPAECLKVFTIVFLTEGIEWVELFGVAVEHVLDYCQKHVGEVAIDVVQLSAFVEIERIATHAEHVGAVAQAAVGFVGNVIDYQH